MKVKGVRLYGVKDIRLEEFEIPEIAEDEILLKAELQEVLTKQPLQYQIQKIL